MLRNRKIFEDHHDMFRDSVQKFIKKHVVPYHDKWDKKGIVSRDFWLEAGAVGILCPDVPSKYGGGDGDFRHNIIVVEELMKVGATGPGISVHSDIVTPYIINYGSEEQKKSWLPGMCEGRLISAIWDDWKILPKYKKKLLSSDIFTLRRITPKDRGFKWGLSSNNSVYDKSLIPNIKKWSV